MLSRRQRNVTAFFAACAAAGFLFSGTAVADPNAGSSGAGSATTPAATTPPAEKKYVNVPSGDVVNREDRDAGLIVEDLKIGEGYEVKADGVVVVHYHGTLKADPKKVFDSSYAEDRGQPITFPLKSVIAGWQKGVPGMKIGGVRRLTVPAAMAYGDRSPSADIPANSDLVFIVELVDALQIEDVKVGEGQDARPPFAACVKQTIKGKDGKDATLDGEHMFIWLPGEIGINPQMNFDTMQTALQGMKVGGKRRIVVPKELNNSAPDISSRPSGVPLTIEVELVAVRNLPSAGQ